MSDETIGKRLHAISVMDRLGIERLVVASTRYYLGRMTAGTVDFAEGLVDAWERLPDGAKRSIRRELREAFEADNRSRARLANGKRDPMDSSLHPLGMNCDRDAWEKVARVAFTEEEISDE